MAVGLNAPKKLFQIEGVRLSSVAAGMRYQGRDDLLLIELAEGSSTVAVFTQNKFCAAPVILAKKHIQQAGTRALLINAGNANAGTGKQGLQNVELSCQQVAEQLAIDANQVLPFSTGVIGEQLSMQVMSAGIKKLKQSLQSDGWLQAASTIMTTDTVAKGCSKRIELDGVMVTITGIAKGSGMICPNMATLLSYVATDANINEQALQSILDSAVKQSFNRITVDSDTSTNDALVLVASNKADMSVIETAQDKRYDKLYQAIESVLVELATSVIRDAEGASKFVRIQVSGGKTEKDCAEVAYTVAHSPLVKTALFASDANWGRILAAIGRAKIEELDISSVSIAINDVKIIEFGEPSGQYDESRGQQIMSEDELTIDISLGNSESSYHVWTSDLSHEYVTINADYRS